MYNCITRGSRSEIRDWCRYNPRSSQTTTTIGGISPVSKRSRYVHEHLRDERNAIALNSTLLVTQADVLGEARRSEISLESYLSAAPELDRKLVPASLMPRGQTESARELPYGLTTGGYRVRGRAELSSHVRLFEQRR